MTDGPVVFAVGGTVELHRRLTDALSDLGLSLSPFPDPSAACAQTTSPALILASGTASGLSMSEVCRELRASPGLATIPLVAVASTDAEVSESIAALQAGAMEIMTLPDHPSLLRARVANLLRLARSARNEDSAAELHRSRQMLRLVLDNIPQRVFWKDRSSRYLGCNATFAQDAGLADPAAIVGKTDLDLSWKESADRYRSDDQLVMASGQARTKYQEAQSRGDGSVLWLETSKVPLRNPDGAIVGMLGTYEDITPRKEVEATLARRDRRLASTVRLLQRPVASVQEFMEFALDEAIALTGSKIGYIYTYDQERRQFGLITWSKDVMRQCAVVNPQSVYDLDSTGAWGEVVRQGRPIVINDFENDRTLCRGYPQGHAALHRFASVPVVVRDRIVGVAGVANKAEPYDETDVLQLTLLMEAAWKVLEKQQAEERLIGEIVERKQAEETLRRKIDEVEQFFAVAPELLCVADATGILRKTSASWQNQLGYSPTDLHERNIADFLHPDDLPATTAAMAGLTRERPRLYFVNRLRTRDGGYRHIEWHASVSGSLVCASGRDITERLDAHAEIERLNQRFQLAARSADLGVWDWDVARNELVWDDRMCALFGVRSEAFGGTSEAWEAALHPEDREAAHEAIRAALFDLQPFDTEVRAVWPSGEVRNIKANGRVLRDAHGQAIRMTGICYDITERKRAFAELRRAREEAEAATRAKSEFLANVSHEIRTPLNGILGLSRLALACNPNAKQRDYLNKIQSSGYALLDVINDVLDLSKMEAARFEIHQAPFALDHVLADVADTVGLAADDKNVTLRFRTAPDVPLALHGDALRVRQVLMNLVSNAVKFTEHGQVDVTVALQARSEMRASLAFTVKDTGIGMSSEQLSRLFQPFAQADGSLTRKYGGTGLGLVITKKLVQLMGGQIAVQSVPNQGSTFSFTLDFNLQASAAALTTRDQLRILVLDANANSRDYLSAVLSNRSLTVQATASQAEALLLLARGDPGFDVILVAWDAPDQSGLEIARALREALTPARCPPILLVSSQAKDGIYDAVEAAGLAGLIRRPFRVSELLDAILEAAGRQRSNTMPPKSKVDFAGTRVLVVEDVEINRQIVQELLEMAGASVEMAGNGREAIERLAKEGPPIDVVLMDVQMPVMDGLSATRQIRATHGSTPPIIAMTAHALEAERLRCLEAGMNDHLAKPVEPSLLFETLSKWTKRRVRVVATGPTASGSPEIVGFDWDLALRRWNNNETRLRGALARFADSYAKAADNVREALLAGDQTRACDLLHELKGVAGILGASTVQQTAEALETEVRSGHGAPTSALMTTLSRTLDVMMQGISQLAPVPVTTRSTSEMALPLIEMVRNLREIDELLAQNKLAARQRFASIKNALAAIQPAHAEQLEQDITRLAYKSARQVVASLITQLKQPM